MGEIVDSLTWLIRVGIGAGILWGGWLCVSEHTPKPLNMEHFASYALVILALLIGT